MQSRIPATLYEVAWQYSLLDWYSSQQSDDLDFDLKPEHLAYLTPTAKSELFGERESLLVAYADLSDPENPRLRASSDGGPVELTTYTRADRFRVGHSYPENKTSSMTDYSITTQKSKDANHLAGLNDHWTGTNNLRDRFTEWPTSEFADEVRAKADASDVKTLDALARLGEDADAMESLSDAFLELVPDEEEELEVLITVRVKLPGGDEWLFPGEIPVLNEVMREKKANRLQNTSVTDASGEGVGIVSDEPGTVTGGSTGLFGMYGKEQREHMPDVDDSGSTAWQARPLRFDTAAAIASAGSLFDQFYRGLGNNRRIYILPYLAVRGDELDPDTFAWFHDSVYARLRDADTGENGSFDDTVAGFFGDANQIDGQATLEAFDTHDVGFGGDNADSWEDVRFAIVHQVTGNPDRVFFDTLDGGSPAIQLENSHNEMTSSPVFSGDGIFNENPPSESSSLLGRGLNLVRYILYGGYFWNTTEPTRTSRQASETPGAGAIDDSEMQRVRNLLTGTQIGSQELLDEYIHQLVQDQNKELSNDSQYTAFPTRSVVEQYTQIHALDTAGVLDTTNTITFRYTQMPSEFENRNKRLGQFIDNHAALSGSPEQAVFTLGGLVGRISAFQNYENVSSTLIRRYPIDYLTKQTVKEVTKEVLQMNNSYAEAEEKQSYRTNSRYTDRLADTMLSENPQSWTLTESELQWLYSLGIAYGLGDSSLYEEDEETDESSDEETTDVTA